jgi:hypothetical protein
VAGDSGAGEAEPGRSIQDLPECREVPVPGTSIQDGTMGAIQSARSVSLDVVAKAECQGRGRASICFAHLNKDNVTVTVMKQEETKSTVW